MNTVLKLRVNNHPGVMSHITGLFARRAFNVDGILCLPIGSGEQSHILLRVQEDQRLNQLVLQLEKLQDVVTVNRQDTSLGVFAQLESAAF